MIKNIRWTFISQITTASFSLLVGILMMRFIPPEDYGLIAMIIPAISFLTIFNSFAVSSSIVSKIDISDSELSSLFWSRIFISTFLATLLILCSFYLVSFYNEPRLNLIINCYSVILLLNSINYFYNGFYKKRYNFKALAQSEILSVIISGLLGLFLASKSYGYKSILVKDMVFSFLIFGFGIYNINWFPKFYFNRKSIKYHYNFGFNVTVTGTLNFFSRSLDDILIGKKYGSQALGLYSKGYSLLILPISLVSKSFTTVLLPYIAKEQKYLKKASQVYLKAVRGVLGINTPLCILIYFICQDLVSIFLGEEWSDLSSFIKVFALLSIFQSVGPLNDLIYEGLNKTQKLLKYSFFVQGISISSILLGYILGDSAFDIAIYYAVGNFFSFFINQYYVSKVLEIKQKTTYLNMAPFLISGATTFLLTGITIYIFLHLVVSVVFILVICIVVFVVYFLCLFLIDKGKYFELYNNFKLGMKL